MTITLNMNFFLTLLVLLGCIAMIFLIILIKRLAELFSSIDDLIKENKNSIGLTVANLPSITDNVDSIVENAKEITDDATKAKDKIKSGITTGIDVAKIVKDTFKK